MMRIVYGGDTTPSALQIPNNGIVMEVVSLDGISRVAQYSPDGMDYLYTEWSLQAKVMVNPDAFSYDKRIVGGEYKLIQTPNSAMATDVAVRPMLECPRRRLTISFLSAFPEGAAGAGVQQTFIDIPRLYGPPNSLNAKTNMVDVKGGPFPLKPDIIGPFGNGETLIYNWGIKFYVNEQNDLFGNPGDKPPLLLSNRWTMSRQTDRDGELSAYETTRVIQGEAIFRIDRLIEALAAPDQFARTLIHPVPLGYQRQSIRVVAYPDGSGISYQIIDRQMPISFTPQNTPGAVKITAIHKKALVKKT